MQELEALSSACEGIFAASGRRADLDRWYLSLAGAMMHAIQHAEHPRTPRAVLHMGECDPGPARPRPPRPGPARPDLTLASRRELPPAARRAVGAARARAGGAAARVPRALLGRAAGLRHAVLRPPARETHAVL